MGNHRLGREMTKEEFLKKLPEKTVKNGVVVDVRSEISKHFKLGSQGGKAVGSSEKLSSIVANGGSYDNRDDEFLIGLYKQSKPRFLEALKNSVRIHLMLDKNLLIKNTTSLKYGYDEIKDTDI